MPKTKVLHITNGYSGSAVYKNLIQELDALGVQQIVYNPIRKTIDVGKNNLLFKTKGSEILYRPILNLTIDRYLYPLKINKIYKDIIKQVDFSEIDYIHAHTWYSDGGVAYFLSKIYKIPFIITIRNTDLNLFQKKLKYLRPLGKRVLSKAEKVILISASYKNRLLEQSSLKTIKEDLNLKLKVIPNGIDSFWLQHSKAKSEKPSNRELKLLYIGKFTKNKNVVALQKAVILLNEEYAIKATLDLVGRGRSEEAEVLRLVKEYPNIFVFHGEVYDKQKLMQVYRNSNVFAMPSKGETFGLVYVEAMLQGLPILYTKNEGIDGTYNHNIGEAVTIGDVDDIKEKLLLLYENYTSYEIDIPLLKSNHDWSLIAKKYLELYSDKS